MLPGANGPLAWVSVPRPMAYVPTVEPVYGGRRGEHPVGVLVLEVEHARERERRLAELGVVEGMRDLLAAQPDLAAALAQPVEELRAGAGALL